MNARRVLLQAALLAVAVSPALAQEPSEQPAASARPQAVERSRSRARDDGDGAVRAPRAERVSTGEVRPRVRAEAAAPATAAPPAFEEQQGGRRRPSGGGSGGGGRSGGGMSSGGGSRGDSGAARPRNGGVRNPDGDDNGGQVAQAVPRGRAPRPSQGGWGNSYGRRYYSGPSGLGYYYYDPWSWYGWGWPAYGAYGGYYGGAWGGYGGYGGGYGTYGGPTGWSIGGVRLKVSDRDAEVYVDGYYAGIVDDFDGIWQQLRLDDGGYRVEIKKPGFETLVFDVRVQPGRTITYRGEMHPAP